MLLDLDATKPSDGVPASKSEMRAKWARLNEATAALPVFADIDFGVAAGATATDNDAALIAMRDAAIAAGEFQRWIFPKGQIDYTNNRWLRDVERVIVEAYGTQFRNVLVDAWFANMKPLNGGNPFDTSGDVPVSGSRTFTSGFRFSTANARDTTITLVTAGETSNFSAGTRVLIMGYDQQGGGGFPPNYRFFEYQVIDTVGAGTLTFTQPLRYSYDDRWPDYTVGSVAKGKPRVLPLERSDYVHPRFVAIRGAEWLVNPNEADADILQVFGDLVLFEDVKHFSKWAPSISGTAIARRMQATDIEVDKLIDFGLIDQCEATNSSAGGTGCNRLVFRDSRVAEMRSRARHLTLDNIEILASTTYDGAVKIQSWPIDVLTLRSVRVLPHATTQWLVDDGRVFPETLTVGSVNGTNILIPWDATAEDVTQKLAYDAMLSLQGGGNSGHVTAIYHDGGDPGNLVIEGTWNAPNPAEVWEYNLVQRLDDGGGNYIVGMLDAPFVRT